MKKSVSLVLSAVILLSFVLFATASGKKKPEPLAVLPATIPESLSIYIPSAPDFTIGIVTNKTETTETQSTAVVTENATTTTRKVTTTQKVTQPEVVTQIATQIITQPSVSRDMTKSEFVTFLNSETAKASRGTYNFSRNCSYTSPIDVGGATNVLNGIIQAIDENSDLNTVVGGFLDIGNKSGMYPRDYLDSDYALKATKLTEYDIQNFVAKGNGRYEFTLANATNPKKNNTTPVSRFTNDFITHEEISSSIAESTTAVTVSNSTINYDSIKVTVTVADGKITSLSYSYNFDATLEIKAGVKILGDCAAKTTGQYTNIKY